jgi:ubiquinone/menaquinone biosynthesis C-methylase UbiE
MPVDWDGYLADYHARHPGITERLLNSSLDRQGRTPYEILAATVAQHASSVLDIACGSAPMASAIASVASTAVSYVGIDLSANELLEARAHHPGVPLVLGDALALPFLDDSFDVVLCSMGLMLMRPVADAIAQIGRVTTRGGSFAAMFPTIGAPSRHQLLTTGALLVGLRSTPKMPQSLTKKSLSAQLQDAGFTLTSYRTVRYALPLESAAAATDIVDGLYLPNITEKRISQAKEMLRRVAGPGRSLPVHITYLTATKSAD